MKLQTGTSGEEIGHMLSNQWKQETDGDENL